MFNTFFSLGLDVIFIGIFFIVSPQYQVCAKFELVRYGIISLRQAFSHKSSIISLRWTLEIIVLGRTLVYDITILLLRPELTRVHKLFSWHTSKIRANFEQVAYSRIESKATFLLKVWHFWKFSLKDLKRIFKSEFSLKAFLTFQSHVIRICLQENTFGSNPRQNIFEIKIKCSQLRFLAELLKNNFNSLACDKRGFLNKGYH